MPAIEEKKRKRKDKSEKSHKKKHKKEKTSHSNIVSATHQTISSPFSEIVVKLYMHLAPMWAGKTVEGVNEQLNAFLMKYVPEVDGIVLAHSDVKLDSGKGKLLNDSPFCHFFISAKFLVWKPKRGTKIVGRINLQSEDHIGLLIYGTFNASISKSRIPATYEWRMNEDVEVEEDDTEGESQAGEKQRTKYGEWVNTMTGACVGGEDNTLEFNVVDIIEANDILTVMGSL